MRFSFNFIVKNFVQFLADGVDRIPQSSNLSDSVFRLLSHHRMFHTTWCEVGVSGSYHSTQLSVTGVIFRTESLVALHANTSLFLYYCYCVL